MAHYRYKAAVTDNLEAAHEIILNVGRMITDGKIDKQSTLTNLAQALEKIEPRDNFRIQFSMNLLRAPSREIVVAFILSK